MPVQCLDGNLQHQIFYIRRKKDLKQPTSNLKSKKNKIKANREKAIKRRNQ